MAYCKHTYLWMTLDPVHIGTGGHRLGRVDLSIAREPGTKLPKIPGTSLSGAARSYAAMQTGDLRCAGQGQPSEEREGHCGACSVCYTFGSLQAEDEKGDRRSYAGTVNVFDGHLLLFPVHSMAGPVWVTCPERLQWAGLRAVDPEGQSITLAHDRISLGAGIQAPQGHLNLGWLLLESNGQELELEGVPRAWQVGADEWDAVRSRAVLVSDKLFGQIVDANLEVRTSVSIDPYTGAAEEGALFTYEAIPRSAFLVSDVVEDSFRQDPFPQENGWERPLDVVQAGLRTIEWLGVGGMGTRGFGRMRVVGEPYETPEQGEEEV